MRSLPFPGVTGRSRRAHWRRQVARRAASAALLCTALVLVLLEVRPPPGPTTTVLLARHPMPGGSLLGPTDLQAVEVPVDSAQPGSVTDPAEADGRRIGSGLAAGEALTRTRLVARSPADGLPPSRTAVHVVVADPASVSLLHVGQPVAVVGPAGGPALTRDARVLSVDPAPAPAPFAAASVPAHGVVLDLDTADVEQVLTTADGMPGPPVVHVVGLG